MIPRLFEKSPLELGIIQVPAQYLITRREIAARFGALTFLPQPVLGEWTHQQVRYEDVNLRIVVDVEETS